MSLRYAVADLMEPSCLRCHNDPETGSPKINWEVGQVRGVLEIIRPLDATVDQTHRALQWSFLVALATYGSGIVGLGLIVQRLRRTTRQLRTEETRTRAIVNTTADGIVTLDERGLIESFNAAAAAIFNLPASDVVGRHVSLLIPPPYSDQLDRWLASPSPEKPDLPREIEGKRKDGSRFPMDLAVSAVEVESRRIVTATVRDLTPRHQALDFQPFCAGQQDAGRTLRRKRPSPSHRQDRRRFFHLGACAASLGR
jgi:PAS domain S-box-containing protein